MLGLAPKIHLHMYIKFECKHCRKGFGIEATGFESRQGLLTLYVARNMKLCLL
jgi:hypothetical protein